MATLQTPVIRFPYPFILHTPNPHPDPSIQFIALVQAGGEGGGEVTDGSLDHPVDLQDHLGDTTLPTKLQTFFSGPASPG
jgi:hypothetical protein